MRRPTDSLRLFLLGLLVLLGLMAIGYVIHTGMLTDGTLAGRLEQLGRGVRVVAVGILTVGVVLWIPLTLLVLLAISVFNPFEALLLCAMALALGSSLSYLLARTIGHGPIERLLSRQAAVAKYVRGGFARRAFASLVLMRAAGVSSNLASYLAGVTGVRWRVHITACLAGELSGMATTAFLGHSVLDVIRELSLQAAFQRETFLGLLSGVLTLGIIGWAQHRVRRQSEEEASGDVPEVADGVSGDGAAGPEVSLGEGASRGGDGQAWYG